MVYYLIGFAIVFMVGNLLILLPSKRQREQMKFRQQAISCDFVVRKSCGNNVAGLENSNDLYEYKISANKEFTSKETTSDLFKTDHLQHHDFICFRNSDNRWSLSFNVDKEHFSDELKQALNSLPKSVCSVILYANGAASAFWKEDGDLDAIIKIKQCLQLLQKISY